MLSKASIGTTLLWSISGRDVNSLDSPSPRVSACRGELSSLLGLFYLFRLLLASSTSELRWLLLPPPGSEFWDAVLAEPRASW